MYRFILKFIFLICIRGEDLAMDSNPCLVGSPGFNVNRCQFFLNMGTVDFGTSNNPFVIGRKYDWDAITENPFIDAES